MYKNLTHLVTLAALAETGSFAAAARRLQLPTSTVSEHIAALERNLGVQLVVRTTRQSRLTDIGQQLARGSARMVETVEETFAELEATLGQPKGKLRISLPFAFAADSVGPAIARFAGLYPGIELELWVSNDIEDLISGGFDLAIRIGPLTDSTLTRRSLGVEPQNLVAARAYLDLRGRPERLDDLTRHCFVGFKPERVYRFEGPDGGHEITLKAQVSVNDPKTAAAIVKGGAGIGLLPRYLSDQGLEDGSLEIILPAYRPPPAPMAIVYYGQAAANPRADLFARFLEAQMRRPDRWQAG